MNIIFQQGIHYAQESWLVPLLIIDYKLKLVLLGVCEICKDPPGFKLQKPNHVIFSLDSLRFGLSEYLNDNLHYADILTITLQYFSNVWQLVA